MTNPKCPHGHTYGTCLMCYHDLVAEQQSEIERLRGNLSMAEEGLANYALEVKQLTGDRAQDQQRLFHYEGAIAEQRAAIEQLHAAVKTAQELAARRLMEIERLQSNQREHNQEITELTQNRDDYKADYLRMHKMFMDLKYPDTVPAHEPLPGAPDPRDAVIAELTKWADDWAVYRGPAEKPVDKGWRLAAEELQSILKKSATRT